MQRVKRHCGSGVSLRPGPEARLWAEEEEERPRAFSSAGFILPAPNLVVLSLFNSDRRPATCPEGPSLHSQGFAFLGFA